MSQGWISKYHPDESETVEGFTWGNVKAEAFWLADLEPTVRNKHIEKMVERAEQDAQTK